MYDPERGWSLSFSGCGFLGFYHIGATRCLSERAPHLLRDARMLFGSSAGALHGVVFLSGISLGTSGAAAGAPRGAGMGQRTPRGASRGGPSPDGRYLRRVLSPGVGSGGSVSPAWEGGAPGLGSSGCGNPERIRTPTRLWRLGLQEAPRPGTESELKRSNAEEGAGPRGPRVELVPEVPAISSRGAGRFALGRTRRGALACVPGWALSSLWRLQGLETRPAPQPGGGRELDSLSGRGQPFGVLLGRLTGLESKGHGGAGECWGGGLEGVLDPS